MNRVIPDKYFALDGPTPAKIRVTIICSARSQSLTTTKSNFGLFCPKVYLFTSLKVIYERDSNPGPLRYRCNALPTELSKPHESGPVWVGPLRSVDVILGSSIRIPW